MPVSKDKTKTPSSTAPSIIRKSEILTQAGDNRVHNNASPKAQRPQIASLEANHIISESPIKKRTKNSMSHAQDESISMQLKQI